MNRAATENSCLSDMLRCCISCLLAPVVGDCSTVGSILLLSVLRGRGSAENHSNEKS